LQKKTTLDEIDAKILKTLLKESRTSFTKMAKDCKITVGAVRMRYKRLWRVGIIKGEMMLVNPHSLGYKYISDLGITTAVENEKEVLRFLASKPYIAHIVGPLGKYNIWAKVALHDTQKLAGILEDIESNPYIRHVDAFIWVKAVNIEYPENLMIKPLSVSNEKRPAQVDTLNGTEGTQVQIDETDRKIAMILSQNSRTPFRRIAQQLGISTKSVIQRYKRLREKVLCRSSILIDLNKLGYTAMASVFVKAANRSKMAEIHAQMVQMPNLIVAIRLIGPYDLYAAIVFEDFGQLFNVAEQIRQIKGIEKTETFLTPVVPAWPLNLFPGLLQSELMMPKFYSKGLQTDLEKS
jgi:Lrp/AsnC family transcriptional regulator for asnA, asnC and gidA